MREYGSLLKELIGFSGMKMSAVADLLNYDISYISKWCSQTKLPGAKTAAESNRILAQSFADEIERNGDAERFAALYFSKKDSGLGLEESIFRMLRDAYRFSVSRSAEPALPTAQFAPAEAKIMTDAEEILLFFRKELAELIGEGDAAVLCTFDLCQALDLTDAEPVLPKDYRDNVRIKFAVCQDTLLSNSTYYLKRLYYFLNRYNMVSFDLYDDSQMHTMNTLVVKDRFAVFCAIDNSNHIRSAAVTYDAAKVEHIYRHTNELFRRSEALLHSSNGDELEQNNYRTGFYARDSYQIFSAKGFEYLLPPECWDSILRTADDMDDGGFAARMTVALQIAWEENFEKADLKFYIPKSIIMRYMEDGELIFFDFPYRMSSAQRKKQIQNVLDITAKNPNIKFCIINDDELAADDALAQDFQQLCGMTIYSNRTEVFAKNLRQLSTGVGPKVYYVSSKRLVREISAFFDALDASPFCTVYDAESLRRFVDRYGSLIDRMLDLSEKAKG